MGLPSTAESSLRPGVEQSPRVTIMSNPYKTKPDYCFWSRSVSWCPPGRLDPMVGRPFTIGRGERIATLGSCFAQHIARHLEKSGLDYFVAEQPPPGMGDEEARRRNYGVFSARYGNVYTVRQAVQLFDRAFGRFAPVEDVWPRGERYVDPFRPTVDPEGFASPEAVRTAATEHLTRVRSVFCNAAIIVFTLGLTEGWRSKRDGAMFPIAPGVSGGTFDPDLHEPVNFTIWEVMQDLNGFIERILSVNSAARILLTVSPVPLIATHEDRHVVVSTTYSKSVLRVAAAEAEKEYPCVTYFPSYEIITSPHAQGAYFESDLRSVSEVGVQHVMRVFSRHFLGEATAAVAPTAAASDLGAWQTNDDVVCDEEEIERALRASGFKTP